MLKLSNVEKNGVNGAVGSTVIPSTVAPVSLQLLSNSLKGKRMNKLLSTMIAVSFVGLSLSAGAADPAPAPAAPAAAPAAPAAAPAADAAKPAKKHKKHGKKAKKAAAAN